MRYRSERAVLAEIDIVMRSGKTDAAPRGLLAPGETTTHQVSGPQDNFLTVPPIREHVYTRVFNFVMQRRYSSLATPHAPPGFTGLRTPHGWTALSTTACEGPENYQEG